jgi:3-deoxy-manno-octulosonate cytidylyltransferase (CMP-KDO synthetase)
MIIIPARLASNRFPNKILSNINGVPMVVATAKRVEALDRVVIATDDQKVVDIVLDYGFEAVLTGTHHQSGTDRIFEATNILDVSEYEIIVNVQADEPFIEPTVVQAVIERVKEAKELDEKIMIVSCYKTIDKTFANDPNHVKVITDVNENAIYFSRSKIPYDRQECLEYFGHLGIYGFTKKSLKEFCSLPPSPLEDIEKLEQLRAIYHGKKIAMVKVESQSFGIDTPQDLEKALKELQ